MKKKQLHVFYNILNVKIKYIVYRQIRKIYKNNCYKIMKLSLEKIFNINKS